MDGFTCQELLEIARKYSPILLFDSRSDNREEEFFPINVEAWLSHVAAFVEDASDCPERGTSLWTYPPSQGTCPDVDAGSLNLRPVAPDDTKCIGSEEFRRRSKHFLNFGSWAPWPDPGADDKTLTEFRARVRGNQQYLFDVFDIVRPVDRPSGTVPAEPSPLPSIPQQFAQRLATYCEVARGDNLAELAFGEGDEEGIEGAPMDESARKILADYLVLTYHYFYPAMQPFKRDVFNKKMEGQWETISVFLKMYGHKKEMLPRFVVYSVGYERNLNNWWIPKMIAESWTAPNSQLKKAEGDPSHPLAYVAWGTHGNYFSPQFNPIDMSDPDTGEVIGQGIFVAGWVTMVSGIAAGNIYAAVGGLILMIIGGLIWLFASLCGDDDDDESSEHSTYLPESDPSVTDHHNGEGPSVGVLGCPSPTMDLSAPEPVVLVLHLIDPSDPGSVRDSMPVLDGDGQPIESEYPYWWDYAGRWGVVVDSDSSKTNSPNELTWMHGSRRVDSNGVSRSVLNMHALLDLVNRNDEYPGKDYDL